MSACLSIALAASSAARAAAFAVGRAADFTVSPSSTSRRMASARDGLSSCFANQSSSAASGAGCIRTTTWTPMPVGAGPRFFFASTVCFLMKTVLAQKQAEGKVALPLGSNPSHKDSPPMTQADRVLSTPPRAEGLLGACRELSHSMGAPDAHSRAGHAVCYVEARGTQGRKAQAYRPENRADRTGDRR